MQSQTKRPSLRLVGTVNSEHRAQTGDELLEAALCAYEKEAASITDAAPIGWWLIHRPNRKPQLCWEDGQRKNGKARTRYKTIELKEASEWADREAARDEKRRITQKINALYQIKAHA